MAGDIKTWIRDYKKHFMLNSAEHENLNAHKCKIHVPENSAFVRLRQA